MTIANTIKTLAAVDRTNDWNGRTYITLAAVRGSRANADLRTKVWAKGDVLTIERGKGYHSSEFAAQENALVEAVKAAGGTVREI